MRQNGDEVLDRLPVFPVSEGTDWHGLRIEGMVRHPVGLSLHDLEQMPQRKLAQDFRCEEGWVVPDQRWEGVSVADLLELAEPLPGARYVALSAGDFTVSLTLEEAMQEGAILALRLDGAALPREHGGPCRLVAAGKTCYYSVKWLDSIQVAAEQPRETGREIALERIREPATAPQGA